MTCRGEKQYDVEELSSPHVLTELLHQMGVDTSLWDEESTILGMWHDMREHKITYCVHCNNCCDLSDALVRHCDRIQVKIIAPDKQRYLVKQLAEYGDKHRRRRFKMITDKMQHSETTREGMYRIISENFDTFQLEISPMESQYETVLVSQTSGTCPGLTSVHTIAHVQVTVCGLPTMDFTTDEVDLHGGKTRHYWKWQSVTTDLSDADNSVGQDHFSIIPVIYTTNLELNEKLSQLRNKNLLFQHGRLFEKCSGRLQVQRRAAYFTIDEEASLFFQPQELSVIRFSTGTCHAVRYNGSQSLEIVCLDVYETESRQEPWKPRSHCSTWPGLAIKEPGVDFYIQLTRFSARTEHEMLSESDMLMLCTSQITDFHHGMIKCSLLAWVVHLDLTDMGLVSRYLAPLVDIMKEPNMLETLVLDSNPIDDSGAEFLVAILESDHCSVKKLSLCETEIGDAGLIQIAQALVTNTTITSFYLTSGSRISYQGEKALFQAMNNNLMITELQVDVPHDTRVDISELVEINIRFQVLCRIVASANETAINTVDELGWSLLHYAARKGAADIVAALLQYKDIDVDQHDFAERTPLSFALLFRQNDTRNHSKVIYQLIPKANPRLLELRYQEQVLFLYMLMLQSPEMISGQDINTYKERFYISTEHLGPQPIDIAKMAYCIQQNQPHGLGVPWSKPRHWDMSKLSLTDQELSKMASYLTTNTVITTVCLKMNKLTDVGIQHLTQALTRNHAVETLNLGTNPIGPRGATLVGELLRQNSNITQLDLHGCQIEAEGCCSIAQALIDSYEERAHTRTEKPYELEKDLWCYQDIGLTVKATEGSCLLDLGIDCDQIHRYPILFSRHNRHQRVVLKGATDDRVRIYRFRKVPLPGKVSVSPGAMEATSTSDLTRLLRPKDTIELGGQLYLVGKSIRQHSFTLHHRYIGHRLVNTILYRHRLDDPSLDLSAEEDEQLKAGQVVKTTLQQLFRARNKKTLRSMLRKTVHLNQAVSRELSKLVHVELQEPFEGKTGEYKLLTRRNKENVAEMTLSDNNFTLPAAPEILSRMLETYKALLMLDLSYTKLGIDGLEILSKGLAANSTLRALSLIKVEAHAAGARHLANALKSNTQLHTLLFRANDIQSEGVVAISEALIQNQGLLMLDLSHNGAGLRGSLAIARMLGQNKVLKHLELSSPGAAISGYGMIAIFSALEQNSSLEILDLAHNSLARDHYAEHSIQCETQQGSQRIKLSLPETSLSNIIGEAERSRLVESQLIKGNEILISQQLESHRDVAHRKMYKIIESLDTDTFTIEPPFRARSGKYFVFQSLYPPEYVAKMIRTNTCLQTLDISGTRLDSTGATTIAKAFQRNHSLRYLNLSKNTLIENAAAVDLADGLESNLTLCELPMSGMATSILPYTRTRISELLRDNQRYRHLRDHVEDELQTEDGTTPVDEHGNSLLHYAAMKDGTLVALRHVEQDHVNIDVRNKLGHTALYYALKKGNVELSRELIKRGCSIEQFPRDVHSQLIQVYASIRLERSIVRSIIAAIRADRNQTNLSSHLQFLLSFDKKAVRIDDVDPTDGNKTPLHWAVQIGATHVVETILENFYSRTPWESTQAHASDEYHPANIDRMDHGKRTALHYATLLSDSDVARDITTLLIKYGADASIKSACGDIPMHYAALMNNLPVAVLLLEARHGHVIDVVNCHRQTPLHAAVCSGSEDMVVWLVSQNASLTIKDHNGHTATSYAMTLLHVGSFTKLCQKSPLPSTCERSQQCSSRCWNNPTMTRQQLVLRRMNDTNTTIESSTVPVVSRTQKLNPRVRQAVTTRIVQVLIDGGYFDSSQQTYLSHIAQGLKKRREIQMLARLFHRSRPLSSENGPHRRRRISFFDYKVKKNPMQHEILGQAEMVYHLHLRKSLYQAVAQSMKANGGDVASQEAFQHQSTQKILDSIWKHRVAPAKVFAFVRYILFLFLLSSWVTGRGSLQAFFMGQSLKTAFVTSDPWDGKVFGFQDIREQDDWYAWSKSLLVNGLYSNASVRYDGEMLYTAPRHAVGRSNVLLGKARLRQVRSQISRGLPTDFADFESTYVAHLTPDTVDKEPYGPNLQYKWTGQTQYHLLQKPWRVYPYTSGGFIQDIPSQNKTEALRVLSQLETHHWIDAKTAAVVVQFSTYNMNLNKVCYVEFIAEFAPGGLVVPSSSIRCFEVSRYSISANEGLWQFTLGIILLFFVLLYITVEYYESQLIVPHFDQQIYLHTGYWLDPWNYFDILNLSTLVLSVILHFVGVSWSSDMDWTITDAYIDTQPMAAIMEVERFISSLNLMMCWLKLLDYMCITSGVSLLVLTIIEMLQKLISFGAICCVFLFAFSGFYTASFGQESYAVRTFSHSIVESAAQFFGQIDFKRAEELHDLIATSVIILFLVVVVLLLQNFLVAFMGDAYESSKDLATARWCFLQFEMIEIYAFNGETMSYLEMPRVTVQMISHLYKILKRWCFPRSSRRIGPVNS